MCLVFRCVLLRIFQALQNDALNPVRCVQGADFFQNEYDRLERMLSSGKVGGSKLSEISQKLSVLGAFLEEKYNDLTSEE